jgi:hypothetical protein
MPSLPPAHHTSGERPDALQGAGTLARGRDDGGVALLDERNLVGELLLGS